MAKTRILMVDDHAVMRMGLRQLICTEPDLDVVADVGTLREAREGLRQFKPDLLMLDLGLGDAFSLGWLPRLREDSPETRILVLSAHAENLYAERVLRAGAQAYLMKTASWADILAAIRRVLAGQIAISAEQQDTMLRRAVARDGDQASELSARELEVLRLVASGRTTAEIAQQVNRSVKTIESHKQSLKVKLHADTPAQLMRIAINHFESTQE